MRVEPLDAADHEDVVALGAEAFQAQGSYGAALRAWLRAEGVHGWVIREKAGPLDAFALFATAPGEGATPKALYLLAVATRPERRREGLARLLLSSVLIEIANATPRAERVDLHVDAANAAAIALFSGLGFVPAPGAALRYPTGAVATCLRFDLAENERSTLRPRGAPLPEPASMERR